jgi:NAD(P)-dependent dehydrogenase (short-subunit alcohol dehydrogenase family)
MELFALKGKLAVVTGGAQGIGAATARLFEQCGAKVAILDLETGCDVTDEAAVSKAFSELGGVDILVNSVWRAARKPALELSSQEWDQVLNLNLKATFICSRTAAPYMKKRGGGAIVNLASIIRPSGGTSPSASYRAPKSDVVNLTRTLALEWAADNIRVNAVAPAFVRADHTPLGRLPEVEDIAAAILYLCSPAARCVTGIALPVDSGYLAG